MNGATMEPITFNDLMDNWIQRDCKKRKQMELQELNPFSIFSPIVYLDSKDEHYNQSNPENLTVISLQHDF